MEYSCCPPCYCELQTMPVTITHYSGQSLTTHTAALRPPLDMTIEFHSACIFCLPHRQTGTFTTTANYAPVPVFLHTQTFPLISRQDSSFSHTSALLWCVFPCTIHNTLLATFCDYTPLSCTHALLLLALSSHHLFHCTALHLFCLTFSQ